MLLCLAMPQTRQVSTFMTVTWLVSFAGIETRSESRHFQFPSVTSQNESRDSSKDNLKDQVTY